ncbi:hypothetical protein OG21DRAFT_1515383 [Imleria badia]|nr:hypothetical protein OG21DRAFT_1515383 [Imleria badia]
MRHLQTLASLCYLRAHCLALLLARTTNVVNLHENDATRARGGAGVAQVEKTEMLRLPPRVRCEMSSTHSFRVWGMCYPWPSARLIPAHQLDPMDATSVTCKLPR